MRTLIAATLAASLGLSATPVFAGDQPLPSGTPAGLKTAQDSGVNFLYVVGIGAIIAGAVIIGTNSSGNGHLTTGTPAATTT